MSKITKNNYESYLLDYIEQNLSPDMVAELMLFLEQNPALKAELDNFENTTLNTNENIVFNNKTALKQIAVEDLMIAEIEGLNGTVESKLLQKEIAENSAYASLFKTYQKTILKPEEVVFENKSALKQKETKVIPLYYWAASAAAVLLLILWLQDFNLNNVEQLSTTTEPATKINKKVLEPTVNELVKKEENTLVTDNNKLKPTTNNFKQQTTNQVRNTKHEKPKHQTSNTNKQILESKNHTAHATQQPKNLITINPPQKEYIEIEPLLAEETPVKRDEFLTVSELIKKEAQKRLLENEVKTNSTELVAANVVAKVLGKNAEVETIEDNQGEVKEYALNIGGFSISRKIRK